MVWLFVFSQTYASAETIGGMLDLCISHGTIPFAAVARHGFIGVSFLKSLASIDVLEDVDVERFLRSIHTVAAEFIDDIAALHRDALSHEEFLGRYGHLRPGTYDITSFRYDEMPDDFLGEALHSHDAVSQFELTPAKKRRIGELLARHELPLDPVGLFQYIAEAIRLRELTDPGFPI